MFPSPHILSAFILCPVLSRLSVLSEVIGTLVGRHQLRLSPWDYLPLQKEQTQASQSSWLEVKLPSGLLSGTSLTRAQADAWCVLMTKDLAVGGNKVTT